MACQWTDVFFDVLSPHAHPAFHIWTCLALWASSGEISSTVRLSWLKSRVALLLFLDCCELGQTRALWWRMGWGRNGLGGISKISNTRILTFTETKLPGGRRRPTLWNTLALHSFGDGLTLSTLAGTSKEIIWSPTQRMGDLIIHYPYWTLKVKEIFFHFVKRYKELPLVNRYKAVAKKKTCQSLFGKPGYMVTLWKRKEMGLTSLCLSWKLLPSW